MERLNDLVALRGGSSVAPMLNDSRSRRVVRQLTVCSGGFPTRGPSAYELRWRAEFYRLPSTSTNGEHAHHIFDISTARAVVSKY